MAFLEDLILAIAAATNGDFKQRMRTDYIDSSLSYAAAGVNDMLMSADGSIAEFNRAMAALAEGDLTVGVKGEHRGAFGQLQRNFGLATASMRAVLGRDGANAYLDNATNFAKILARFRPASRPTAISISDIASKPVASPARALRQKLVRVFGGAVNQE